MTYLGIEFKRASAANNSLWAVGGDHQLYVMVFGVEVPIRVKEVSVDNMCTVQVQSIHLTYIQLGDCHIPDNEKGTYFLNCV